MNRIMTQFISDVKALDSRTCDGNEPSEECMGICIRPEYGWHDPKYPPELRKACLRGKEIKMDKYAQLYFLMSGWYEKISGCRAPCNFEVYGGWKKKLSTEGRKKYGLTDQEISILIDSIQSGTRFCKEKRDMRKVLAAPNES